MASLYLDRRNASLSLQGSRLLVRVAGVLEQTIPLALLDRVVIVGSREVETRLLTALADAGVAVHLLSGRGRPRLASVFGSPGNDPRRRLAQYAVWHDNGQHDALVRDLLRLKLVAQRRFVTRLCAARPDARHELTAALETLGRQSRQLDSRVLDREAMRGVEGAASAAGFRALRAVLPPALGFTGRRRRPPPDPANALLSLAYTLAYGLALEAVHAAGLDPAIGYLHEPAHGRQSLAADLMEPLRPRLEQMVWELFRDRTLTADHFTHQDDGACLLGKAGRQIFYGHWEQRATLYRRWLRRLVRALLQRLEEATNAQPASLR